ncbi:phosphoribosyltransferase [Mesorhizobium australicum]|uniref:phosphoribosyltransferase n=1 Tax=Mesorhizobium australicum TaxID=536018 RepID=UPI00333B11B2
MKVHYLCAYYSQWAHNNLAPRPTELWQSYKFCGAVKHGIMNGYLTIPWKKGPEKIAEKDAAKTRPVFGRFIEQRINAEYADCAIVPVPSKDSFDLDSFRSLQMVQQSLPAALQAQILPIVRFTKKLEAASRGGLRGFDAVFPHLEVATDAVPRAVVLIDDIVTTGGTLLATKRRLENRGFEVRAAIVCGKTVAATEKAFFPREFELTEEEGQIDI